MFAHVECYRSKLTGRFVAETDCRQVNQITKDKKKNLNQILETEQADTDEYAIINTGSVDY